jgi:hypothetical protein
MLAAVAAKLLHFQLVLLDLLVARRHVIPTIAFRARKRNFVSHIQSDSTAPGKF